MTRTVQYEDAASRAARMQRAQALIDGDLRSVMCVEDLRLKNLQLGDDAAPRLLRSIEHVPSVKHLDLSFNVLGAAAMAARARCAFTLHLESLDLSGNEIGTDGVRALCAADLPELRTLDLSWCELVDSAVHAIAGARGMPSLQNLTLRRNNLTDAGGAALAASAHLRAQLLRLSIDYNDGMTAKGRKLLRAAFDVALVD